MNQQNMAALVKELREKTGAGFGDCKNALNEANFDMDEAVKILRNKGLAAAGKKAGRIASEGLVDVFIEGNRGLIIEVNSETDFVAKNPEFKAFVKSLGELALKSSADSVEALLEEKWPGDADGHTVAQVISGKIATIGENIALRRFVRYEATGNNVLGSYVHGGKIGVLVELSSDSVEGKVSGEPLAKEIAMHAAAAEPKFLRREEVTQKDLDTEKEIARAQALQSGKPENVVDKIVTGKMEKFYGEAVLLEQTYVRDEKLTISQLIKQRGKDAKANYDVVRYTRYKVGEGIQKRDDDFAAEVMAQAGLK